VIDLPPPQVHLEAVIVNRSIERIEIRGATKGSSRGQFTLYAARRCSSKTRYVTARGPFKSGWFRAQLAFSILPARRGSICYRIRSRGSTLVTASRHYRVPSVVQR
jgi:hypothetical protein